MNTENKWAAVPDYEGLYEIDTESRVRNVKTGNILSPGPMPKGGWHVQLRRDGKSKWIHIHVAAYIAHVGPILAGMVVTHADGDDNNNAVENLRLIWREPRSWNPRRLHPRFRVRRPRRAVLRSIDD